MLFKSKLSHHVYCWLYFLDKRDNHIIIYLYCKKVFVGTHWKLLIEMLPKCTTTIMFGRNRNKCITIFFANDSILSDVMYLFCLFQIANSMPTWAGPPAMLNIFRKMFGSHSCPSIIRQNNFTNLQHYFIQKVRQGLSIISLNPLLHWLFFRSWHHFLFLDYIFKKEFKNN